MTDARKIQKALQSIRKSLVPAIDRNGHVVVVASAVRSLDYGFISVFLGVYLDLLDFSPLQLGIVLSAIMAGGALSNIVASWRGDTIGRRRMLVAMAILMGVGGILFPLTEQTALLVAISLMAVTTSTGGDRTAFLSLDMSILAQSGSASERTALFSWYNLLGRLTKALGSLMIAAPAALQAWLGMEEVASYKAMFLAYSVIAFAGALVYWKLTPAAESSRARSSESEPPPEMPRSARTIMIQLAVLFSLDSLGGGFMVQSFMSFFFANRFDMSLEAIAAIFFAGQILNAVSIMLAAPIARRIGLITTMAASQGIANSVMILMALTGNWLLAVVFFLIRELINDMDIPTRQSYSMAIVSPEARTAMAGVTNLGRTTAQSVSPALAGLVAQSTLLGAPIVLGSLIKLVYNGALYVMFKSVKAPEEGRE